MAHSPDDMRAGLLRHVIRDDSTIPVVCFEDCNNAYILAARAGKTTSLCNQGSPFRSAVAACQSCIKDNAPVLTPTSTSSSNVPPSLAQFLDYCNHQSSGDSGLSSLAQQFSAVILCSTCGVSTEIITDNNGMIRTVTALIINSGNNTLAAGIASASAASSGDTSRSTGPIETSRSKANTGNDSSRSKATWIAGPILGSVMAVWLIFGVGVYLYRRRRLKAGQNDWNRVLYEKSELHSVCIPRSELCDTARAELDDSSSSVARCKLESATFVDPVAELAANEYPAQEMPLTKSCGT